MRRPLPIPVRPAEAFGKLFHPRSVAFKIVGRKPAAGSRPESPEFARVFMELPDRRARTITQGEVWMTATQPYDASAIDRIFGVVLEKQTYKNIGYLLLSFPLGLLYFLIIIL
jgi:hypothetical protein